MCDSTINGPVQVAGQQINNFIGQVPQPSAQDLLRNRQRITRATYWQMKRELLLWVWNACLAVGVAGTMASVLAVRGGGLTGDLLRENLLRLVVAAVIGWSGDALFFWARRRLESQDNPLLTRGGPVLLYDVLPRVMVVICGGILFVMLPRISP
ncbi:hypothetical protein J7E89_15880 [Streptomyces sp. ISL-100]|nr:hypothetical protein [Streptomyces sp. ISL-100]